MDVADFEKSFRKQLELCKVHANETLVFLTDRSSPRPVIDSVLAVSVEQGLRAYELRVSQGRVPGRVDADPFNVPGIQQALEKADVAMCFFSAYFSRWHKPFRARGGRILNVLDTPEQLSRLQGGPALKKAVLAAKDHISKTKTVRVTNVAGTDLHYRVDHSAPIFSHYGFVDEPSHMDQWGQGMVAMFPEEGSANGKVVIQPGDVWILPYARMVQSTIELEIRDGHIEKVSGGVDAGMFQSWLSSCKTSDEDKDPFAVSHLGWGLNPNARWDDIINHENDLPWLVASMRSFPGNFLFSTGPGHKRVTRGHIDMPMRHCTLDLDGETVVRAGTIIADEMVADANRRTH